MHEDREKESVRCMCVCCVCARLRACVCARAIGRGQRRDKKEEPSGEEGTYACACMRTEYVLREKPVYVAQKLLSLCMIAPDSMSIRCRFDVDSNAPVRSSFSRNLPAGASDSSRSLFLAEDFISRGLERRTFEFSTRFQLDSLCRNRSSVSCSNFVVCSRRSIHSLRE